MPEGLTQVLETPAARRALIAAVGIVLLLALRVWARHAVDGRVEDHVLRYRIRKVSGWLVWMAAAVFLAAVFSDWLGGLGIALGVAGAGIAFALQEVIVSVAGWLAIVAGGFYRTGDRVQLGGIKGDVIDIGVIRTTLFEIGGWVESDNYNGRIVRIANSFVFKEPVFNYSADFTFLWDEIRVPIHHGSDRALAQAIFERVLDTHASAYAREVAATWKDMTRKYLVEPAHVSPSVTLTMDEHWLTYTLRYVVGFRDRRSRKDVMFRQILDEVDATGGKVRIATAAQEVTVLRAREDST